MALNAQQLLLTARGEAGVLFFPEREGDLLSEWWSGAVVSPTTTTIIIFIIIPIVIIIIKLKFRLLFRKYIQLKRQQQKPPQPYSQAPLLFLSVTLFLPSLGPLSATCSSFLLLSS